MQPVSDELLLQLAGISAGLVGLFLVGVFFFIETGFRRVTDDHEAVKRYFKSGTRIVLVLFAFPIFLSLSLVALDPVWSRVLFVVLSLLLIVANVDSARRVRPIARSPRMLGFSAIEILGTIGVLLLVVLPWILGGFEPTREHFMWAILIAFVIGFISFSAVVLSAFDVARVDVGESVGNDDHPPPVATAPITENRVIEESSDDPRDV